MEHDFTMNYAILEHINMSHLTFKMVGKNYFEF